VVMLLDGWTVILYRIKCANLHLDFDRSQLVIRAGKARVCLHLSKAVLFENRAQKFV
jgi:hypothetical protein